MHKDQDLPGSRRLRSLQQPRLCQGEAPLSFPSCVVPLTFSGGCTFHLCSSFLLLPAGFPYLSPIAHRRLTTLAPAGPSVSLQPLTLLWLQAVASMLRLLLLRSSVWITEKEGISLAQPDFSLKCQRAGQRPGTGFVVPVNLPCLLAQPVSSGAGSGPFPCTGAIGVTDTVINMCSVHFMWAQGPLSLRNGIYMAGAES